ncbi:MAG: SusC/RagA family TonB-linked outer membrane protein [Gemmatimonadota bacterium]
MLRRWNFLLALASCFLPAVAGAQEAATITGRVVDQDGVPLGSAQVVVDGLNLGTLTNAQGRYLINVPAARATGQEARVRAVLIGYRTQEQTVVLRPGTITANFTLSVDPLMLDALVVTGVGQATTRERLGVAISSVESQSLDRVPEQNVVTSLAGKAPGVEIVSSSGDPGAATFIRIRGVNTLESSGQPLFVVDGIPVNNSENFLPESVQYGANSDLAATANPNRLADLNPQDIESIQILKGAAASAIYGARAANGVVLITTKSGEPGSFNATLTTTMAFDQVNQGIPLQRMYGQGTGGVSYTATDDFPSNLRSWGPEVPFSQTYDHWGELFETGRRYDTNLSLSGATDRMNYYLSLGRSNHNGVVVGNNDRFDKTMGRLKATYQVTDKLTVTGNIAYTQSAGSFIQKGSNLSGLLLGGARTPPDFNNSPYLTPEGYHRSFTNPDPQSMYDWWIFDNPLWTINKNRNTSDVARTIGSLTVDYAPFRWLKAAYTLGSDYSNDDRMEVLPIGNYTWVGGFLGKASFVDRQVNQTLTATASRQLTDWIGSTFTAGYERNVRKFSRFYVEGLDFVAPDIYSLDNTVTRQPDEVRSLIHSESYFGQLQFELLDQLFVTGALRNDGFSTFGRSNPRHWYPKASAAWEFTKSLGLGNNDLLSYGKLRVAWGQAGNEPPVYGTIGGYTAADIGDAGWNPIFKTVYAGRGGLYTSFTKEQPDLKPERTSEIELGFDLSLLNNRVGLNATYYNDHTVDGILRNQLAPSTGYGLQLQNEAEFRNRGVELAAEVRAIQTRDFSWTVHANWSTNDNRVLDLGGSEFVQLAGGAFTGAVPYAVLGERIGVLRGNDFYRCGNDNLPANVQTACQGAPRGAVYIGDQGYPVLDPTQRVIADPQPDWLGTVGSSFQLFNNVELYAQVDIKKGGDLWNGTRGALYSYGTHKDTEVRGLQATYGDFEGVPVVGPGANTVVAFDESWFNGLGGGFGPVGAQFIEDGGYVKLREVAVAFTVPSAFSQSLGLSNINVRLSGRNLVTWTKYTGIDPETNLQGTSATRGYDYFNNPQTRQFILSVGLKR